MSERDPMDLATSISRAGLLGRTASFEMRKSDSERTLPLGLRAIPSPLELTPVETNEDIPFTPTARTPLPSKVETPLLLVTTLLPPALLLLSQLGPIHLFSPPLILPVLDTVFNSPSSFQPSLPDTSSHDMGSSSASSFTMPPPLPPFSNSSPSYSHELHAASTLSVPAVSAAAIWRIFRGLEWVTELSNEIPFGALESRLDEEERIFDFPAVLQGVADALAADAARRGVELVIGRIGFESAPSPATTPSVKESSSIPDAPVKVKEFETRELLLRADERAWSVALIWVS